MSWQVELSPAQAQAETLTPNLLHLMQIKKLIVILKPGPEIQQEWQWDPPGLLETEGAKLPLARVGLSSTVQRMKSQD